MAKKNWKKLVRKYGLEDYDEDMQKEIIRQIERRRFLRRLLCMLLLFVAIGSLGYFLYYNYSAENTGNQYAELEELKKKKPGTHFSIHMSGEDGDAPEILEEYQTLYAKNKSFIGWIKIDGTNIDYPVMQTSNFEYYLDHNFEQEYDRNGSIFLDPDCDVIKPSTNIIIYGHNMRSGNMFGSLDKYSQESFMKEHPEIRFDSLYRKGKYKVMYVFRDRLYDDTTVTFKYYQFIDTHSPEEFDSNMKNMAEMSLYDTGVTAKYGDELITLSTCDHSEENGRFVVVAKKIS